MPKTKQAELEEAQPEIEFLEQEEEEVQAAEEESHAAITPMVDAMMQTMQTTISPEQVAILVERLMARIQAEKRLRVAVLSKTNHLDWVGFRAEGEGEDATVPYLTGAGCKKVMATFGVEIEAAGIPSIVRQEDGTALAQVVGKTRARFLSDAWWPVYGARWSGDPFFVNQGTHPGDYDPGDLLKSALTNFFQEAVKTALALDTVTWDELKEAGVEIERVKRTSFQGKQGSGAGSGSKAEIASSPHIRVFLAYKRSDLRESMKKTIPPAERNFDGSSKTWQVKLTKKNLSYLRDMEAGNSGDLKLEYEGTDDPEADAQ